jgi:hypothetical protein
VHLYLSFTVWARTHRYIHLTISQRLTMDHNIHLIENELPRPNELVHLTTNVLPHHTTNELPQHPASKLLHPTTNELPHHTTNELRVPHHITNELSYQNPGIVEAHWRVLWLIGSNTRL